MDRTPLIPTHSQNRNNACFTVSQVNPGLLDIFLRQARDELQRRPREKQIER